MGPESISEIPSRRDFKNHLFGFVTRHPKTRPKRHISSKLPASVDWLELSPEEQVPVDGYNEFGFEVPGESFAGTFRNNVVAYITFSRTPEDDEDEVDFLILMKANGHMDATLTTEDEDSALRVPSLDAEQSAWVIGLVERWMIENGGPMRVVR